MIEAFRCLAIDSALKITANCAVDNNVKARCLQGEEGALPLLCALLERLAQQSNIIILGAVFAWLPIPENAPGQLRDKLLVAWVAYHASENERIRGKAECQVSILFLELLMRYSTDSAAEAARKRLTKPESPARGGWLTLTRQARGRFGNYYKLGKRGESDAEAWRAVGEMLFGPGGVLEPYRCRPLFSRSGLGPNGCVVLATIERGGSLTGPEVVELLDSYMDRSTVRRQLGYLKSWGLVVEEKGRVFTTHRLRSQIEQLERDLGAADRCLQIDNGRDRKWIAYQTEILGRPEIDLIKATLRKLDCFYCGRAPLPTGGEVERFPPEKWGGSYEYSLLLPICDLCNSTHGNLLGRTRTELPPVINDRIEIRMSGNPSHVADHFMKVMVSNSLEYATAMNEGRLDDAKEAALRNFPVWAALKGLGEGVRLVNLSSGEIDQFDATADTESLIEFLDGLRGVPELLAPLDGLPRKYGRRRRRR